MTSFSILRGQKRKNDRITEGGGSLIRNLVWPGFAPKLFSSNVYNSKLFPTNFQANSFFLVWTFWRKCAGFGQNLNANGNFCHVINGKRLRFQSTSADIFKVCLFLFFSDFLARPPTGRDYGIDIVNFVYTITRSIWVKSPPDFGYPPIPHPNLGWKPGHLAKFQL